MTHQHGGRPGSGTHGGGKGASGGGSGDVGSRNWEIAHGIDVGGNASKFAYGSGNNGSDNGGEDSSGSEGESIYPGIFSKIKKLKAKQLRNILISIFKHYGMRCTIEALVDREALRGEEES